MSLYPGETADAIHLWGFAGAQVFTEAMRRMGPDNPTRDRLVETLEGIDGWKDSVVPEITIGEGNAPEHFLVKDMSYVVYTDGSFQEFTMPFSRHNAAICASKTRLPIAFASPSDAAVARGKMTRAVNALHFFEEGLVDGDVLDGPLLDSNPDFILAEQFAQFVAINQVDRRCAISNRFRLGCACEGSRRDQNALVSSARHGAAEVPNGSGRHTSRVALALEIGRKAHE